MTAELENLKVWHTAHCAQIGRQFEGWNCYLYKWCNESYIYWNEYLIVYAKQDVHGAISYTAGDGVIKAIALRF